MEYVSSDMTLPCLQSPLNPNPSTATSHHHRNNHHGGMQQFLQNFLDHPLPPHRAKNPTPPTLQTSDAASLSLSCPDHTPAGQVNNNNNPHRGSHHSSFSSSFARSVPQQLMGPAARRASFSFLSPFEEGCGVSAGHSSSPSSQQVDNDPRRKRIMKNRESAARSRARRQAYTYELERERAMLIEENARLRHKLREQDHQSVGSVAAVPAPPQQTPKKKCLSRTISASF